jgi:MoaA/NifB/PqqE/SkfB family radical SAM enzyme
MNGIKGISGSNGGPMEACESQVFKDAVARLYAREISLAEFRSLETAVNRRRTLTVLVNNECNLACRHCYLQLLRPEGSRLSPDEWETLFANAWDSGVEQFVIAGKEPLLGKTGPEVLGRLQAFRRDRSGLGLGVITNGTRIPLHRDLLLPENLCYLDLSMDGDRADHDVIRGEGAFAEVAPHVEWAAATLGERFFVSLTVEKRNLHRLKDALLELSRLGVRNVGFSFYIPLSYTDQSLILDEADYDSFFRDLGSLGSIDLAHPMHLHVDAGTISPPAINAFMRSEWFNLDIMDVDRAGFMYSRFRFDNGMPLSIRFVPVPIPIQHMTRVGVDGTLVCVEDSLKPRQYAMNRLGNVRDTGFDYGALIEGACEHPRLRVVERAFEVELLPTLQNAYSLSKGGTRLPAPAAATL